MRWLQLSDLHVGKDNIAISQRAGSVCTVLLNCSDQSARARSEGLHLCHRDAQVIVACLRILRPCALQFCPPQATFEQRQHGACADGPQAIR